MDIPQPWAPSRLVEELAREAGPNAQTGVPPSRPSSDVTPVRDVHGDSRSDKQGWHIGTLRGVGFPTQRPEALRGLSGWRLHGFPRQSTCRIVTEPRIPFWERALDEPPPAVRVEGAAPRGPGRWALPLVARTLNSDTVELSLHAFPTTC
ncbi:hypothetical protein AB1E19_009238 [Capra hircus]